MSKDPELKWELKRNSRSTDTWVECQTDIGHFSVENSQDMKYYVAWTQIGSDDSIIVIKHQVNRFEAQKATERFIKGVKKRV